MKHIEKLSYKYINTYGRFSQHRKSEEPIIDKINEIIDILQNKGLCKLRDKNASQLIEIVKLRDIIKRIQEELDKYYGYDYTDESSARLYTLHKINKIANEVKFLK